MDVLLVFLNDRMVLRRFRLLQMEIGLHMCRLCQTIALTG